MCGIAGVFGPETQEDDLDLMLARLVHRGPDDHGKCLHNSTRLGHARLSIIDVDGGRQPLFNEDGSVCIVFNLCGVDSPLLAAGIFIGEIYNHQALRSHIESSHVFRTRTDTEVILHLYDELGDECIALLDGMFALAIHDTKRGILLARVGSGHWETGFC